MGLLARGALLTSPLPVTSSFVCSVTLRQALRTDGRLFARPCFRELLSCTIRRGFRFPCGLHACAQQNFDVARIRASVVARPVESVRDGAHTHVRVPAQPLQLDPPFSSPAPLRSTSSAVGGPASAVLAKLSQGRPPAESAILHGRPRRLRAGLAPHASFPFVSLDCHKEQMRTRIQSLSRYESAHACIARRVRAQPELRS